MNILITHPNFPAQFKHLAKRLAENPKNRVFFLAKYLNNRKIKNVHTATYRPKLKTNPSIHDFAKKTEEYVIEGQAVALALKELKSRTGFVPDIIIGHVGWGSLLYIKDVFPNVPILGYFEWYYRSKNFEDGYWNSDSIAEKAKMRLRTMNTANLISLDLCDAGICPMNWQKSNFPSFSWDFLKTVHDGIDTKIFSPELKSDFFSLPSKGIFIPEGNQIVTYVSRGLEPYRGFPQFMDAIRIVMEKNRNCHFVIAGADKCFYGRPPKTGTWKSIELQKGIDLERVHFTGTLPENEYLQLVAASDVHVYLTRPFVLSWSFLEFMSSGKCLIASNTPPVQEVMKNMENGILADFWDSKDIASKILEALDNSELRKRLGKSARETVLDKYEKEKCLSKQLKIIQDLV